MKFSPDNFLNSLTLEEREEALRGIQHFEKSLSTLSADDIAKMIISLLGDEEEQRDT
jgi:hypothetical protein